jgi:hypothetical protein
LNQEIKMNLDENQTNTVARWIEEGVKLAEIQTLLDKEFGIKMTYMEVRFLVDDLNLTPKEPEPEKVEEMPAPASPAVPAEPLSPEPAGNPAEAPIGGGVSVSVDTLMKPGALVSGNVTFSDGNTAEWYLDQTGRLGLSPKQEGYRPSPADVQAFQAALEKEITRAGL